MLLKSELEYPLERKPAESNVISRIIQQGEERGHAPLCILNIGMPG